MKRTPHSLPLLPEEEQFRIARLQVFNWGTFADLHDIPIAERGFLFVGRSGTGKTTLLDAFSALLIPPKWVDFNAAAAEGERSGRDRTLVSYVRGAWAEQQDDESGMIGTQFLRAGATWSGLALTYRNPSGRTVTLVQLFWIRGNSSRRDDLRRYFLIFERPFDLREIGEFHFDVRKLKQKFPDAFAREEFSPYGERFCRLLGIDNELALRLLHKTQSAKNLGDLNAFLRDFMLDKPETFAAADRLVAEFTELNAAHQAVVEAREQVQTLAPARTDYQTLESVREQETGLEEVRAGLDGYKETCRAALLEQRISKIETEAGAKLAEVQSRQGASDNQEAALEDLRRQHRESGGQRIEDLESEQRQTERLRDERLRKRASAQSACEQMGWRLPASTRDFADMETAARQEIESWPDRQQRVRSAHSSLSGELAQATREFTEAREEVDALRRQPSNVPARMLRLRAALAGEVGIAEGALPFAAELMEVPPAQVDWRGAIERVLHGFALSLLVEERYYAAVSEVVNRASLGERLLYNRIGASEPAGARAIQANSVVRKLQVKDGPFRAWMESQLRQRFDYACVESMQAFRATERALTREGQVRHGKDRHEKDDRFDLNDRSRWVLGFDNRAKLELFEQRAREQAAAIDQLNRRLRDLAEEEKRSGARALICQGLANLQWSEIDAAPIIERLNAIRVALEQARAGSPELEELHRKVQAQAERVKAARDALIAARGELTGIEREAAAMRALQRTLIVSLKSVSLTARQSSELATRFNALPQRLTLDNADRLAHQVDRALSDEQKQLAATHNRLVNAIEKRFAEFQRRWKMDAGDLDATLSSASDFFARLKRLENDRLPDYEHRFFDLLRNQSLQNLAALSTHLNQARKTILDRLELVNESLGQAEFNPGTFLHIDPSDRNLDEVREFRQEIQQALSHAWTEDREEAEARFRMLRNLVERMGSQEPERKRWRTLVLDVRQHVEFVGREFDGEGRQVEVYRGGGGKSGGQRQKLATTCLAAALRYQLAGEDRGLPRYAPVVLDEAFDKADNEFTALAMNIFARFGFQMIVATPLKSVMTLEPFIGGACFVDITARRHSGVLLIEYDTEQQRLKLPERLHGEAHAAIS